MSLKSWKIPAGLVIVLIGVIWFLQGIDVLGGSAMSGVTFWALAGIGCVIGGGALVVNGVRNR